jgi:hypothetical protein
MSQVAALPPFSCGVSMVYSREWVPPPHGTLHALHCPQPPTQSSIVSHCSTLQLLSSVAMCSASHAAPAPTAATDTTKERERTPPPQLSEHRSQSDHAPTQSTGQSAAHSEASRRSVSPSAAVHARPPPRATVVTTKVRSCTPPPQSTSHSLQAPHDPTQSTAACSLRGVAAPPPPVERAAADRSTADAAPTRLRSLTSCCGRLAEFCAVGGAPAASNASSRRGAAAWR